MFVVVIVSPFPLLPPNGHGVPCRSALKLFLFPLAVETSPVSKSERLAVCYKRAILPDLLNYRAIMPESQDIFARMCYIIQKGSEKMFGAKITALIEDNDKSMEEVAAALNVNVKTLYRWKNDISDIPATKLRDICIYFNISADDLIGISEK